MKLIIYIAAFLFISPFVGAHSLKVVKVPVESVFAPKGFDTNDDSEVIIEGYLPNLCYKSPRVMVVRSQYAVNIQVVALKNTDPSADCAQMRVPFLETASIGVLDRGKYNIFVNTIGLDELEVIESSSSAIDDYIYANVHNIEIDNHKGIARLKGYNPSDCFEFARFEYISNEKNVYSVLPIMKQVSDFCPKKEVPFSYEFEIPKGLKSDRVLLHVRSMNGKSVNKAFAPTVE